MVSCRLQDSACANQDLVAGRVGSAKSFSGEIQRSYVTVRLYRSSQMFTTLKREWICFEMSQILWIFMLKCKEFRLYPNKTNYTMHPIMDRLNKVIKMENISQWNSKKIFDYSFKYLLNVLSLDSWCKNTQNPQNKNKIKLCGEALRIQDEEI